MHAAALLLLGCLAATSAAANEVRVPLQLDFAFMRELLVRRAFTDPEQTAMVFSDGVGCSSVTLLRPALGAANGRLVVTSDVDAKFGTLMLGTCLFPVSWQGRVESQLVPQLDPALPIVHFHVVDSTLLERDGAPAGAAALVWDWVKRYVHPRLELVSIDLAAPVGDLRTVLPLFLSADDASIAQGLVDSLALESAVIGERGVSVQIRLTTPPLSEPQPVVRVEPELTPEEIAAFESALARWDGFVTFVIKQASLQSSDPALREQLFETLLDARYRMIDVLQEPQSAGPDPVRPLFLETWKRLSELLRALGPSLGDRDALRWLGFIAANDALAALDGLGSEMGLEISSDGLRRLARVIAPDAPEDPLATPTEVDPDLRRGLGFDDPLPPPEFEPDPEPEPEPAEPPPLPPQSSLLGGLIAALLEPRSWLVGTAQAATPALIPDAPLTRAELTRLHRFVPTRKQLGEYLPLVRRLLRTTADETARRKSLSPAYWRLTGNLQVATAWQESCWRQYVRLQNSVRPLRSTAGAVGLMQVNARAWRGFYDARGLEDDIAYNARAGSEILLHYLVDLAIARGEHRRSGGAKNLVRATYAAYNGGPSHLTRYRREGTRASLRSIDASFLLKYEAARAGRDLDVARCFG